MILDYESAEVAPDIESQVCIVGGGPAGITLALELAKSGIDVALLEGGGTTPSAESQRFYAGENIGQPYFPLDTCRLRVLGGSSTHWSGWCGPLDESDFQRKDWIPLSGWPIARSDLEEHYRTAHQYLNLGPFEYGVDHWASEYSDFPDFEAKNLVARLIQFSSPPVRFGTAYFNQLDTSGRIRVYLHANATRLDLGENGQKIGSVSIR
ncbi:MAG: FAD-dependent oxidoreductase, partial [Woeseiaceae bacterium]